MKADYVHKDTLTATDYVELNKTNELLVSYNQVLLKEIQELKKQLETYKKLGFKYLQDKNNNLETQQKEFIKWLEDEIQQQETVIAENQEKSYFLIYEDEKDDLKLSSQKAYIKRIILEENLQKYKSVIGDDK